jgi:hypothetical protein
MINQDKLKAELLLKYSRREPVKYLQYDAITDPKCCDPFEPNLKSWEDDVAYFSSENAELMSGSNVRVLIRYDTGQAEALKALKGIFDLHEAIRYCERCGGKNGDHYEVCRVESLTAEQVQVVMNSMEKPFNAPPFLTGYPLHIPEAWK